MLKVAIFKGHPHAVYNYKQDLTVSLIYPGHNHSSVDLLRSLPHIL